VLVSSPLLLVRCQWSVVRCSLRGLTGSVEKVAALKSNHR
jgi:hypothetical protein